MDYPTAYDDDVYAWAYEQAALLRRLGETRRDLPNALDIENLCEEIEGLARRDLREAESFLRLLLLHVLKIASAPRSDAVDHWRLEADTFQADFRTILTRTIRRKIEIDQVWARAKKEAAGRLALQRDAIIANLPSACPMSVDDLADDPFDLDDAVARIRAAVQPAA